MTRAVPIRVLVPALVLALSSSADAGIHPPFALRSAEGEPTTTPSAVDVAATCGGCHDVPFITGHTSHRVEICPADCLTCHLPGGLGALLDAPRVGDRVQPVMRPPTSEACGACHGAVHRGTRPFALPEGFGQRLMPSEVGATLRTGEVFGSRKISDSFLNLSNKATRDRPFDIHAARGLECASCHVAANNPKHTGRTAAPEARHLRLDPRSISMAEYLERPDHRLAGTRCETCHDAEAAHPDMPARARHLATLACQSCHVPDLAAPAARVVDQTARVAGGGPRLELRGFDARGPHPNAWFGGGYRPFLLREGDGRFAPYNVIARWWWVDADGQEVLEELVRRAWLTEGEAHHPEVVAALDQDGDGALHEAELALHTAERAAVIARRLTGLGVAGPTIQGRLEVVPVRHGVAEGRFVDGRCDSCHGDASRLTVDIPVADVLPGGVTPALPEAAQVALAGRSIATDGGGLRLVSEGVPPDRYVLGTSRPWTDTAGLALFALTVLGVSLHGGRRVLAARRGVTAPHVALRREYLYGAYERLWHWIMAFSVLLLIVTGLVIHYPGGAWPISFAAAVLVHDAMAAVMLVNALLALLFHLATSEIRQFIPEGANLLSRIRAQVRYYMHGIFRGAAHPPGKSRERKLNPLQQLTYVGLLNVLFPLQIGTGILIWLTGLYPSLTAPIGGLALIAPIHGLGSWLFLSFLTAHVYLTTTGHTVFSNLRAMVDGWDEIEVTTEGAE